MHRRQITGKESSQAVRENNVPKFVNTSNLLTTRFLFQRDYKGVNKFVSFPEDVSDKEKRFNFMKQCKTELGPLPVKVVINLNQIRNITTLRISGDAHQPIRSLFAKKMGRTQQSSDREPLLSNVGTVELPKRRERIPFKESEIPRI